MRERERVEFDGRDALLYHSVLQHIKRQCTDTATQELSVYVSVCVGESRCVWERIDVCGGG